MTDAEIIIGNAEICEMLGFKATRVYLYQVPNTFPFEKETDTGWTELASQSILFHTDWNMLIGAYNRLLERWAGFTVTQRELFNEEKNFVTAYGTKNFFHLFENQLSINSCWIKLVDFSKWYNSIKLIK